MSKLLKDGLSVSMKEYVDNQVQWLKDRQDIQFRATREAVDKSEITNVAKFEGQNEWRGQFKDQAVNFVTRRELWGGLVALITIAIGLAALIINNHK